MANPKAFAIEPSWKALLRDLGARPGDVLRRAELPHDLFNRADSSVDTSGWFRLWEALEAESSDPDFPLRVAAAFVADTFSPVCFAAQCSPNMRVASERIRQYKRLVAPMTLRVRGDRRGLTLTAQWLDATVAPPRSLAESEAAFFLELIRKGTREHVNAVAVTLPHRPQRLAAHERYFGAPIKQGRKVAISFTAQDADRPFLTANDRMWAVFEPELRKRLDALDDRATTAQRVRAALLEALPSGQASMEDVAARLALSKRTLQRRLQQEGESFQSLLNRTREHLGRHYLLKTTLPCAEISFLLGYEDPNSFFRAFHEWTGSTPEGLRRAAAAPTV